MRRTAIIASILTLVSACDKPPEPVHEPAAPITPISETSKLLFQVYGSREDLRAVPIAIVDGGELKAISLDAAGWHLLDSLFFDAGGRLPIYRNGADAGTVEVVRGMWPAGQEAFYSLPGCQDVVPQAQLRLQATGRPEPIFEYLASSVPLQQRRDIRPLPRDAEPQGRKLAYGVATAAEIGAEELRRLDFISRWLRTGAGPQGLTLLASYIDPEAGDAGPGAGQTAMVLALAEDSAGTLTTSFSKAAGGDARAVRFHRMVNHADLDGDGVDEIILESWLYATAPELTVLKYARGKWRETLQISENWCLDRPPTDTK